MNSKKIVDILLRIPGPVIIVISWILSSMSTISQMPTFWSADKLIHCICFAGLAGAWTFWFDGNSWKNKYLRNFLICIGIVALYGAIDEIHQSFVPGRNASFFDWLFDMIGATIGTFAGSFLMKKLR